MSRKTVVRRCAIGVGRRATSSGAVLSVPQSDSGVVVEVLTPRVVAATFEMLLLESLELAIPRLATAVLAVARPRLLLGGAPTAVNPRLLAVVLGVEVPGGLVHLVLVVHPHEHLVHTQVVCV